MVKVNEVRADGDEVVFDHPVIVRKIVNGKIIEEEIAGSKDFHKLVDTSESSQNIVKEIEVFEPAKVESLDVKLKKSKKVKQSKKVKEEEPVDSDSFFDFD